MALIQFFFESKFLNGNTMVDVVVPDCPRRLTAEEFYCSGKKYPVLWLLHGTFGDATDWQRRTSIELYACERNVIVVMPTALNSNYSNWPNMMMGYNMYDYIIKELMPIIYGWFPASDKREDNFIAGLSMGGRGTMKFAVNFPEKFAAAAVLSAAPQDWSGMKPGAADLMLDTDNARLAAAIANAGGLEKYKASEENIWRIIDEKAPLGVLPRLLFACGTNDKLIYGNLQKFEIHAKELGLDAEFFYGEGYRHEWRFWDLGIQKALDFFGLKVTGDSVF